LLFEHRQKSKEFPEIPYGQFRINSFLRFLAKNSNARSTKSPHMKGMSGRFFGLKFLKSSQIIFLINYIVGGDWFWI